MFSAHQMGTARMGVNPKKSCVDPEGQCWEVRGLSVQTIFRSSNFPVEVGSEFAVRAFL